MATPSRHLKLLSLKSSIMNDRHDRVTSLIKEQTAKFIQVEANPDPLITVTSAHITPDYKHLTIYITTIPENKENDALIFLKRNGSLLRSFLKKHSSLKHIPHIEFAIDAGERHRQHIDDIAREIKKDTV